MLFDISARFNSNQFLDTFVVAAMFCCVWGGPSLGLVVFTHPVLGRLCCSILNILVKFGFFALALPYVRFWAKCVLCVPYEALRYHAVCHGICYWSVLFERIKLISVRARYAILFDFACLILMYFEYCQEQSISEFWYIFRNEAYTCNFAMYMCWYFYVVAAHISVSHMRCARRWFLLFLSIALMELNLKSH